MAVQKRNDEMINLLEADFLRKRFPLVIYGSFSGWGIWEIQFSTDDIVYILPAGDYAPTACLQFRCLSTTTDADFYANTDVLLLDDDGLLYENGEVTVAIRVLADGSIEAERTLGAETINVRLHMDWI